MLSTLFRRLKKSDESSAISPIASHLIWTNDPPSEVERAEIGLAISCAEQKKVELKALLDQQKSSEARVQKPLEKLDAFISTQKTILSTLRCLPFDLLSYIFALCLDPIRTRPWTRTRWYDLPSFRISQVCRRWRTVALETPILWSFLGDVQLSRKLGTSYSYTKFLETMLRRSKNLDLWIYIYTPCQELDAHRAIGPLVLHSNRWRAVIFETTFATIAAFRGIQHRLSRLQSLSLDLWQHVDEDLILTHFSDAPLLTDVTISGYNLPLELPWGQIKSFREKPTAYYCTTQIVNIFDNSIDMLEHLEIWVRPIVLLCMSMRVDAMKTCFNIPVTFPRLKTMRLTFTTDRDYDFGNFISVLTLPCLEELHIDGSSSSVQNDTLLPFFRRSFGHTAYPRLKRLCLYQFDVLDNLTEILRLVPHLEHFEADLSVFLRVLNEISEMTAPPLLELKTLVINWDYQVMDHFSDWAFDTIKDLIAKRTTPADIRFTFDTRRSAFMVQRILNNWCEKDDQITTSYDRWKLSFYSQFSLIKADRPPLPSPRDINRVFNVIETLKHQEVNYIYACQFYGPLWDFSRLNSRQIPGDDTHHFQNRAKAIIKSWDAIIQADIVDVKSNCRKDWILTGETTLQYVPNYTFCGLSEAVRLLCGVTRED